MSSSVPNVSPAKLVGPVWALSIATALVSLGGFGIIFLIAFEMIRRGVALTGGVSFLIMSFLLTVLAISGLLIRQLSHVLKANQQSQLAAPSKTPTLIDQPSPANQIEAPRGPISSVTDHTTRTLKPVHKDRES